MITAEEARKRAKWVKESNKIEKAIDEVSNSIYQECELGNFSALITNTTYLEEIKDYFKKLGYKIVTKTEKGGRHDGWKYYYVTW